MEIGCVTPVISTKIPGWPIMKEGVPHPLFFLYFSQHPLHVPKGNPSFNHRNMVRSFQGAWQYVSYFVDTVAIVTGVVGYPSSNHALVNLKNNKY